MRKPLSLVLAGVFSVALGAAATFSVARADVKIVSKVTTTGQAGFGGFGGGRRGGGQGGQQTAAPSPTQMYTTYFKGRKARRESADGSTVVIYDRDADKVYTLDPKAKTYYSVTYTSLIGDNADQNAGPFQTTSKLNLKDPTAGAGTVGGIATRDFSVDGTLTMTPPAGGFWGGRRGAQAQGGAATATPQDGNAGATDPNAQNGAQGGRWGGGFGGFTGLTTAVTGSISLASAAAVLPTELSGAAYDRTLSLPLIDQVLPANNQMFKPLVNSIARQQGIPLGAKITMQRTIQMAPAAANGNADTAAQAPPTIPPTTITMEVQSVDKTAALEDVLFAVPTDYKIVDAPTPRGFGGRGGRGGAGGQNGQNGQGGRRGGNRGGAAGVQTPAAL